VTEQPPPEPPLSPAEPPQAPAEPPPAPSPTSGSLLGAQPVAGSSDVHYPPAASGQSLTERPEVKIAATFAGGLIAATILKRLAR
jgi:hypothetical protein